MLIYELPWRFSRRATISYTAATSREKSAGFPFYIMLHPKERNEGKERRKGTKERNEEVK
jgi:hypothetical protein